MNPEPQISVQPTPREQKFIRLGQIDAIVTPLLQEKDALIRELLEGNPQSQPQQAPPTLTPEPPAADPSA